MRLEKFGLGSAQWGMNYGLSRPLGPTPLSEVSKILLKASNVGVKYIDTGAQYGEAENILGCNFLLDFKIITKTPKIISEKIGNIESNLIKTTFLKSLETMGIDSVYGLLIHNVDSLAIPGAEALVDAIQSLKDRGLVSKIGVSIYTRSDLDLALKMFHPDLIQLPLSVMDQSFLNDGSLSELKKMGVEIHARSIFMQGLLLMPLEKINPFFKPIIPYLQNWHRIVAEQNMTPSQAALSFVKNLSEIDVMIVGVDNFQQFQHLLEDYLTCNVFDGSTQGCEIERFIKPTMWALSE